MRCGRTRLGVNGANEIKCHPFFQGVKWKSLRKEIPPFIPELKNEYDTKYFENLEEETAWWVPEND